MTDVRLLEMEGRIKSRLQGFGDSIEQLPTVMAALEKGHQFNAYDSASNGDDEPDEDCEMLVCIGPITDARVIFRMTGRAAANMVADALTLAASYRALSTPDPLKGERT